MSSQEKAAERNRKNEQAKIDSALEMAETRVVALILMARIRELEAEELRMRVEMQYLSSLYESQRVRLSELKVEIGDSYDAMESMLGTSDISALGSNFHGYVETLLSYIKSRGK